MLQCTTVLQQCFSTNLGTPKLGTKHWSDYSVCMYIRANIPSFLPATRTLHAFRFVFSLFGCPLMCSHQNKNIHNSVYSKITI
jgi:hypothetical protein